MMGNIVSNEVTILSFQPHIPHSHAPLQHYMRRLLHLHHLCSSNPRCHSPESLPPPQSRSPPLPHTVDLGMKTTLRAHSLQLDILTEDAILPLSAAAMALPPLSIRGDLGVLSNAGARYAFSLPKSFAQMGPQGALGATKLLRTVFRSR